MAVLPAVMLLVCGCGSVQRELTIKTQPAGAVVLLNDEEIGTSPVTAAFNWYGDYNIRISLEGYETLITHRNLKAPWYDYPPFDLLRLIWPARTTDSYEWAFELKEVSPPTREELIKSATELMQDYKARTGQ
jgi:hypothetical protein